jgi:dienelactone hydrolase
MRINRFCMKTILLLLMATTASADLITKPLEYDAKFKGFLACDSSVSPDSRRPGILVIPEWWGVTDYIQGRAKQLAAMGYVALVADMYGGGICTGDAAKAKELSGALYGTPDLAGHAQAGLDALLKTGLVDPAKVAAIGFCFGGSACQALAYTGAPLAGIVSFHGGLIQPSPDALKHIRCKFLMLNGSLDPMIKQDAVVNYMKTLDTAHIDYQFINYAGALHAFTNPDADAVAQKNNMVGMIGYNEPAARRSWAQMQVFFNEIFHPASVTRH